MREEERKGWSHTGLLVGLMALCNVVQWCTALVTCT